MTDVALPGLIEPARRKGPNLDTGINPLTLIMMMGVVAAGLLFVAYSIYADIDASGARVNSYAPFILLFVALLIARLRSSSTVSRHRQCGRDRDLYPVTARECRGGVVGHVQSDRRALVVSCGRLRNRRSCQSN